MSRSDFVAFGVAPPADSPSVHLTAYRPVIKILLVEEDLLRGIKLTEKLIGTGHDVHPLVAKTTRQALGILKDYAFDIVLINVNLEEPRAGLRLAPYVHALGVAFIFYTARHHHQQEVFEAARLTGPHSYMVRPLDPLALSHNIRLAVDHAGQSTTKPGSFIIVKDNNGSLVRLHYSKLNWVKSVGNYCYFKVDTETFSLRATLGSVRDRLPSSLFMQVHRAHCVAVDRIERLNLAEDYLVVRETRLPIGGKFKKAVVRRFKQES